jgi:hypothetical protein
MGTPVSTTNKTDCLNVIIIMMKGALNPDPVKIYFSLFIINSQRKIKYRQQIVVLLHLH